MRPGDRRGHMVKKEKIRIILTNDDGVFAAGLQALRQSLIARGHAPIVVAPDRGASGASRSLSLHRPLTLRQIDADQYAVDGTPTDCVMIALFEILKNKTRPAILLSGINHGQNLADDVTYSGTCSAAAESCMEGIPSAALSALPDDNGNFYFDDHAEFFAESIFPRLRRLAIPRWSFININFPPRPSSQLRGIRVVPLGRSTYTNPIAKQRHPNSLGRKKPGWLYWIVGEPRTLKKRGTDLEAIERGYVSISPVRIELTDHKLIERYRRIFS